jgi:hypothetical protein
MIRAELFCAAGLVLVHLFAGNLPFLDRTPRSRWLSVAGGISIAYVFVDVFPGLARAQDALAAAWQILPFAEHHAYLVALIGLLTFYSLESVVTGAQRAAPGGGTGRETTTGMGVFWLHMTSFAIYNALVGYLLARGETEDTRALLFYFVAMAVHFALNDHALRQDHRETYTRAGRWLLAGSILVGWGVGLATEVSAPATGMLIAFLAGGVVMNVMKEEEPGRSGLLPFVAGALGYAALLLASE